MLYTEDGESVTHQVRDGDAVLLPYGYHPVSAPPGYSLYYLWAMAGDERQLALYEDPGASLDSRSDAGDAPSMTRFEVAQQIEAYGVVAVIRMQDPARLRAVVDALAAGGVRALEVTMTVPRAIEMIGEIAPTLPADSCSARARSSTPTPRQRVIDAGARFIVSPVFRREVIDGVPRARRAGHAGLLDAHRDPRRVGCRRRHRQGVSRDDVRPGYLKDVRAPAAARQADADRRRHARQRRRLDPRRRRRGRRRHPRSSTPRRSPRATIAVLTANARRIVANVARREQTRH